MILQHTCYHLGQDALHGKNMRVANWAKNANNKQGGYRCTVCGAIITITKRETIEKKIDEKKEKKK